jgi:Phytanoyl-CoA dioxygenase (PhyH)
MKQLIYTTLPWLRTFTSDKIVKSKWLNGWGLQVMRMKLAQKKYERKHVTIPPQYENDIKYFQENGILQLNDFLPLDEFNKLKEEVLAIKSSEPWQETGKEFGPNMLYMFDLYTLSPQKYPLLYKFFSNQKLNDIFSIVEKRKIDIANKEIIAGFQYLVQGPDNGKHDPETDLHADTFFNTHKAWLYLDDVALANGPFTFVPKSHNIYLEGRLEKEKNYSLDITSKGSRRVEKKELDELGLEEKIYTCKANTLVIANTLGYHRRLRGLDGHDRLTIALSARSNPFF